MGLVLLLTVFDQAGAEAVDKPFPQSPFRHADIGTSQMQAMCVVPRSCSDGVIGDRVHNYALFCGQLWWKWRWRCWWLIPLVQRRMLL